MYYRIEIATKAAMGGSKRMRNKNALADYQTRVNREWRSRRTSQNVKEGL